MPIIFEHLRDTARGVPFGHAQNLRLQLRRQLDAALEDFDVLITPTLPASPPRVVDQPTRPPYERPGGIESSLAGWLKTMSTTGAVNLTGHPALTVPSGPGDDGIPNGLQIIGRRFDEAMVYRVGAAVETAITRRATGIQGTANTARR